jgi:hypothetical protein
MTLKCIAVSKRRTWQDRVKLHAAVRLLQKDKVPPQNATGYLYQNAALFPNMTFEQNYCADQSKAYRARNARGRGNTCPDGSDGLKDRYPRQLSAGSIQRAALARICFPSRTSSSTTSPFPRSTAICAGCGAELAGILGDFGGHVHLRLPRQGRDYRLCGRVIVIADGGVAACGDKWDIFDNRRIRPC